MRNATCVRAVSSLDIFPGAEIGAMELMQACQT